MPELIVRIVGDASSLQRSYRQAEQSTSRFGRSMERSGRGAIAATVGFRGLGRAVGFASGAFLGGAGLGAAMKAGFDEMAAGQKVAAQTAAALKSTGAVAGVTARQIEALAGALQRQTGADDEAVQSAENLLLTFTNIRDVAGDNNDIFTQSTQATLDLSQALGQDLTSSAIQLGKALQDPIRGVTALRRVGISFTAAQQKMINRLVETGHMLEAQKIILREVQREVGGSAKAYGQTLPGQLDILRGNLQNLAGELAKTLNPQVERLTQNFNKWLENPEHKKAVIDGFATSVGKLGRAFQVAAGAIGTAHSAWDKLAKFLQSLPGAPPTQQEILEGQLRRAGIPFGGRLGPPGLRGPTRPVGAPPGLRGPLVPGAAVPGTDTGGAGPAGVTAAQRNRWFDAMIGRMLGRVEDVTSLRGQIQRLKVIAGLISQRISVTKDITRRLNLQDQALDVQRNIRQLRTQIQEQARQRYWQQKQLEQQQAQMKTERQLGWLQFAAERAEATKTLKDDVKAQRAIERFLLGRIRHEGRTLDLVRQLWETRQKIRDLNKKNVDVDPLAGLTQVSSRQLARILAAGTGLGLAGRRVLESNIAGAELQPLHIHVEIDGREIGRAVSRDQARTAHRTTRQTSGFRG